MNTFLNANVATLEDNYTITASLNGYSVELYYRDRAGEWQSRKMIISSFEELVKFTKWAQAMYVKQELCLNVC